MGMLDSFLQLLNGETPDQVVSIADITYWIAGRRQDGTADPAWETEEGYLKLHNELGIMPYFWYPDILVFTTGYDADIESRVLSDQNRQTSILTTPVGELRQEVCWVVDSCSSAITRHMVNNEDDLKTMLYILEHRKIEPVDMRGYQERCERWKAYDGIPSIALPRSPLPSFFYEWAGVENAVYLLNDYRETVERALRLMEEQERLVIEAVCEAGPVLIHFTDNLSSDNFTSYFDEYMAEPYRRRMDNLHAAGVKAAVHLDGMVRGLLPKLADVGIDAIEALTPKPAGDLDVAEMRECAASNAVILWGGVPGIMFAPPFTWNQMEKHVGHLLESWSVQRFVVGVADQVPPDGDITFCKRISEIIG